MKKPSIAIVVPNTLARLGLEVLLQRMMPSAEIKSFADFSATAQREAEKCYHYFVSAQVLLEHASFFLPHAAQTIVLTHGPAAGHLPRGLHMVDILQDKEQLTRSLLRLAQTGHHAHGEPPEAVRLAQQPRPNEPKLSARERDVLRGVTLGLKNKEIAARLGITAATVVSHRKSIVQKVGSKSVAALTIYAVMNGVVRAEEI